MRNLYVILVLFLFGSCAQPVKEQKRSLAKFEPAEGKVLLFVGQELESTGGLAAPFNDGYLDHFPTPAGWTTYTNFAPGDSSFGFIQKGLDGLFSTDDWGDSPSNLSMQLADSTFKNMAIAIGLSLVNHEKEVAKGERDSLIVALGNFFKSIDDRQIFLRIGYEFDGHGWNHYDREEYLKSFRHIKGVLDSIEVTNVAYVWQSTGWVSNLEQLEAWYPGDEYVDWCAYSFFSRWDEDYMIDFARLKGKPVFIAEASATISDFTVKFDGQTKETIFSNEAQAKEAWEKWFVPYFKTIDDNPDVVKAVSYINCNWRSHEMWRQNPTFQKVDARLQTSEFISSRWLQEVSKDKFVATEDLRQRKRN